VLVYEVHGTAIAGLENLISSSAPLREENDTDNVRIAVPRAGPRICSTRPFFIAIATDQQISKTDRNQTADIVRSFSAPSYTVVVHLQNYL
jgi:hypothetical protein